MHNVSVLKELGFGERLKKARNHLKMSQTELAKTADMSLRGYQSNERGESTPSAIILKALADYGISPLWILTGNGEMLLNSKTKDIYKRTEESKIESRDIVEAFSLIFANLTEQNISQSRVDEIQELYEQMEVQNNAAFYTFIHELTRPFKSFYLLPVINPKDESAFHSFGSDLNLYEFHPVRRSWVANKKLNPEHLKAVFPSDDAMAPTINQGEIAIIDDRAALSGSGLYALSFQDKIVIRRVEQRIRGLVIMTDSEHYSNEVLSDDDAKKVSVLGRVVRIDSYS
ncbi:XRE family transcriptional regulator [Idiomarina aquatica]|uniref:HTH cro/C1-type domain-containing protein n=1 Tax=Idiomarina aquatica TaxID=1327752 RepID=A0AA94JDS9_9GAMM|nr:S24 family peptidase [Idiomarina aquatica]RUO44943.1 hypothetical protein CWE23_02635 [Idiomarina aquatica]